MKKLILATCLVLSSLAHSGEIVLSDTVYSYGETFAQGDFQINESLGRAWVQLTYYPADPEANSILERKQIKGLSFDATSQEVFLETETGRIVCAYQKTGLFRIKTIRPTGNCLFKKSLYKVSRDNGYEIETITKQKVTLNF
jgi:hypothetical protein